MSSKQLRPGIYISLTATTDLCPPNTSNQCNNVSYYSISQLGTRNGTGYSFSLPVPGCVGQNRLSKHSACGAAADRTPTISQCSVVPFYIGNMDNIAVKITCRYLYWYNLHIWLFPPKLNGWQSSEKMFLSSLGLPSSQISQNFREIPDVFDIRDFSKVLWYNIIQYFNNSIVLEFLNYLVGEYKGVQGHMKIVWIEADFSQRGFPNTDRPLDVSGCQWMSVDVSGCVKWKELPSWMF